MSQTRHPSRASSRRNIRYAAAALAAWAGAAVCARAAAPREPAGDSPAAVRREKPVPASQRVDLSQLERLQQGLAAGEGGAVAGGAVAGGAVAGEAGAGNAGGEKFVPGTGRFVAGAVLQLRGEATIFGGEVKLRQLCRWSDADKAAFDPIGDLVLARMAGNSAYRSIALDEIRQTLNDAGVNLGAVRLAGATRCTITRADAPREERASLDQWIDARQGRPPAGATPPRLPDDPPATAAGPAADPRPDLPAPATAPVAPAANVASALQPTGANPNPAPIPSDEPAGPRSLRDLIVADLAERLSLKPAALQFHFNPADEKVLKLREPAFRFNLSARRASNLGDVGYDVTIVTDTGSQKASISATARAWQDQLVVNKPMAGRQVIRDEDLTDRRALVERVGDDALVTRAQIVGQMAGRDLRAGTLLTAGLIEAVPLIRTGQLVSITLEQGGVQIKTAAKAMEGGAFGQTIRVQNEATRDTFQVVCTGPQEARMSAPAAPKVATLDKD